VCRRIFIAPDSIMIARRTKHGTVTLGVIRCLLYILIPHRFPIILFDHSNLPRGWCVYDTWFIIYLSLSLFRVARHRHPSSRDIEKHGMCPPRQATFSPLFDQACKASSGIFSAHHSPNVGHLSSDILSTILDTCREEGGAHFPLPPRTTHAPLDFNCFPFFPSAHRVSVQRNFVLCWRLSAIVHRSQTPYVPCSFRTPPPERESVYHSPRRA
jgi:hypothetical protein